MRVNSLHLALSLTTGARLTPISHVKMKAQAFSSIVRQAGIIRDTTFTCLPVPKCHTSVKRGDKPYSGWDIAEETTFRGVNFFTMILFDDASKWVILFGTPVITGEDACITWSVVGYHNE